MAARMLRRPLAIVVAITTMAMIIPVPGSITAPELAQGACQSPLTPGTWSGPWTYQVTVPDIFGGANPTATASLTAVSNGTLTLKVACDGSVTGKETASSKSDETETVTGRNGSKDYSGSCRSPVLSLPIVSGTVTVGAGGQPVIDVIGMPPAGPSRQRCKGSLFTLFPSLAAMASSQPFAAINALRLTANQTSGASVSGAVITGTAQVYQAWIAGLEANGADVNETATWVLNGTGLQPTPTPTATPPERPIVTGITSQYQQTFLQGVGPVLNRFTATVDWQGDGPGEVRFALGSLPPLVGTMNSDGSWSAVFDLADLPGSDTLDVVAVNSQNVASAATGTSFLPVAVVPVPAWGQSASWDPKPNGNTISYEGRIEVPASPISNANIAIPSSVPFIGGPWGLDPTTQAVVWPAPNSGGSQNNGRVTGTGGLSFGSSSVPFDYSGQAVAVLDPSGLRWVSGYVDASLPRPFTASKSIGLVSLIPGAGAAMSGKGLLARVLNALNSATGITGTISANAAGRGTVGVTNNTLAFTGGSVKPQLGVTVALRVSIGLAWAEVSGGGQGSMVIQLAPSVRVSGCSLTLSFRAEAGVLFFDPAVYQQDWPVPCGSGSADASSWLRADMGGAAAIAARAQSGRVSPRSASWAPEEILLPTIAQATSSGTSLVSNAARWAAPRLAISRSGRQAMVWAAEDPSKPREQAAEIHLRTSIDGTTWSDAIAITDDRLVDVSPQVAFVDDDHVVVAWDRQRTQLAADATADDAFFRNFDIAWAAVDLSNGTISARGTLTDDNRMQVEPQLSAGADGSVWAAWVESAAADPGGTVSLPSSIVSSRFVDGAWSRPEAVATDLIDTVGWSLSAADAGHAVIAYDRTANASGERDVNLAQFSDVRWIPPRPISYPSTDVWPSTAWTPAGKPLVAWWNGGKIIGASADDPKTATVWLDPTGSDVSTGTGAPGPLLLAVDGSGRRTLAWAGSGSGGPGLWTAHADPSGEGWSAPAPAVLDGRLYSDVSGGVAPSGALVLGAAAADAKPAFVAGAGGSTVVVPGWSDSVSIVVQPVPEASGD